MFQISIQRSVSHTSSKERLLASSRYDSAQAANEWRADLIMCLAAEGWVLRADVLHCAPRIPYPQSINCEDRDRSHVVMLLLEEVQEAPAEPRIAATAAEAAARLSFYLVPAAS